MLVCRPCVEIGGGLGSPPRAFYEPHKAWLDSAAQTARADRYFVFLYFLHFCGASRRRFVCIFFRCSPSRGVHSTHYNICDSVGLVFCQQSMNHGPSLLCLHHQTKYFIHQLLETFLFLIPSHGNRTISLQYNRHTPYGVLCSMQTC